MQDNLVFLHTADWQLGRPFASVGNDSKRFRLQEQRIQTIRELATRIEEFGAAFVIVAGDLFDSPHVTKATVSAACSAIGSLKVPVIEIPGNHDHGGPGSIWEQEFFLREQRQLAPNFQVLLKPEPLVLDSAVIFPAPLLRRHEPGDPTAWIRSAVLDPSLPPDLPRIVLAHGTIQGFGSQQDDEDGAPATVNWIDLSSLPADAIDYIALGDWHGTKQVSLKAWYSGTPEIDRFPKGEGNDPGNILKVTISRGHAPVVEKITTGHFAWKELAFRFSDDASLDLFSARLNVMYRGSASFPATSARTRMCRCLKSMSSHCSPSRSPTTPSISLGRIPANAPRARKTIFPPTSGFSDFRYHSRQAFRVFGAQTTGSGRGIFIEGTSRAGL